jgi:Putative peptidoglycan binding domain/Caspase domain
MDSFQSWFAQPLVREWLKRGTAVGASRRARGWIVAGAALVALAPIAAPWRAEAAGRVALVMVGEDYQKLQKSSIGAKRANDIAEALQAKGFDVLVGVNPVNSRARAILLDFSQKANGADLAIVFLIGHATAAGGQSYFLPVNTELSVSTDLFSRGISISAVAQIASKAKAGAVIVLMTTPNFETAVPGLDQRPEYATENPKSVVTVFSSSARSPVSRIDAVGEQAADAVVKALQQQAPRLTEIVKAASADVGAVFGAAADASLAKPNPPPENVATGAQSLARPASSIGANLQDEPKASAEAERRARTEDAQVEASRLQLQQAKTELEKAKMETQRAQAEASRAKADAEKAKAEAQTELARTRPDAANAPAQTAAVSSTSMDEKLLGKRQRERIQERLRDMSLYTGPVDSIMGPLTREAIMGYQRSKGAHVTGYLTPEQFQALLPEGD